jgi:regulator of cell morphogenesis and NO signaling
MEDLTKVYLNKLSPEEICPTILEKFRTMKEGDQILLEIDHDPLFLPQFLKSRFGDSFSLFIQHVAPQTWNISLLKKQEDKQEVSIAQIISANWKLSEVFEKYDIDYYCHGQASLESVCLEKGLNFSSIKRELKEFGTTDIYNNFSSWAARYLVDFLIDSRIRITSEFLPRITELSHRITLTDGVNYPETVLIFQKVEIFIEDFERFISHEKALVPALKAYSSAREEVSKRDKDLMKQLKTVIEKITKESRIISKELSGIKDITNGFEADSSASFTLKNFYAVMSIFEKHLHKHLHIQNNILFPKILRSAKKKEASSVAS